MYVILLFRMYLVPKLARHHSISKEEVLKVAETLSAQYSKPLDYILRYSLSEGTCCLWSYCDGADVYHDDHPTRLSSTDNIYVVKCPRCSSLQCIACLKKGWESSKNLPTCTMKGCSTSFDEYVLKDYLPNTQLLKLRPLVKDAILDMELSRIPETEAHIAQYGYGFWGKSFVDLSGVARDRQDVKMTTTFTTLAVKKCLIDGCVGFLDQEWKCKRCDKSKCKKCEEPLLKKHKCNKDTVATLAMIKKTCCACPNCGNMVEKLEGCVHMWCAPCKTSYNYVEGGVGKLIPDSQNTNPEYYAYRNELKREQALNAGIEFVDDEPVQECPIDGDIPEREGILLVCATLLLPQKEVVIVDHVHRLLTSERYGIHTTTFEEKETTDVLLLRQAVVLARMGAKVDLYKKLKYKDSRGYTIPALSFFESYKLFLNNGLIDRKGCYNEKKCTEYLREMAFRAYRIRQRAQHHTNIVRMFRASATDILRNIRSVRDESNELWTSIRDEHHTPEQVLRYTALREYSLQQLTSLSKLIEYTNKSFKEVNDILGYSTHPSITSNYNFFINATETSHHDDSHIMDNSYHSTLQRRLHPTVLKIVRNGVDAKVELAKIIDDSLAYSSFVFNVGVYEAVSTEFAVNMLRRFVDATVRTYKCSTLELNCNGCRDATHFAMETAISECMNVINGRTGSSIRTIVLRNMAISKRETFSSIMSGCVSHISVYSLQGDIQYAYSMLFDCLVTSNKSVKYLTIGEPHTEFMTEGFMFGGLANVVSKCGKILREISLIGDFITNDQRILLQNRFAVSRNIGAIPPTQRPVTTRWDSDDSNDSDVTSDDLGSWLDM